MVRGPLVEQIEVGRASVPLCLEPKQRNFYLERGPPSHLRNQSTLYLN